MPIGDFTVLDQIDFRASISAEVEVQAYDNTVSVSVEEFKNEMYFDGLSFKIRSLLRIKIALSEDPDSYVIAENLLEGIEPKKGRYPVSRYDFEIVEDSIRNESMRNDFEHGSVRSFNAARVYSHAHFFTDN